MKQNLKKIMKNKPASDPGYLFHTNLTYPTFPDNTSNFIEDYQNNAASFNGYAILKRGLQVVDYDEDDYNSGWEYIKEVSGYVTDTHLDSWARLYYALSLSYNPLYNVDGTTERIFSNREQTDVYGAKSGQSTIGAVSTTDIHGAQSGSTVYGAVDESDIHGAKSETLGSHTDTTTNSGVAFNSALEKETGKSVLDAGSQTNTEASFTDQHTEESRTDTTSASSYTDSHSEEARSDSYSDAAHTDMHTDARHTETEIRQGNIGVTMSQQLLEAEWEFRKKSFFETIINQLLDEIGFYYDGGIGLCQ